jgi:rRNA maturation endonuclease Nob1
LRLAGAPAALLKGDPLTPTDLERLRTFLIEHHRPYQRVTRTLREEKAPPYATSVASASVQAVREPHTPTVASNESVAAACAKCQGTQLKLEYKFNFFLRCADCKGATPLVLRCASCGTEHKDIKKPDTFKNGGMWSIKCSQCERSIPVEVPQPASVVNKAPTGG